MLNYFKFELIQYRLFRRWFEGEYFFYKTGSIPSFWSDKELERTKHTKYEVHTKKRSYIHDFNKIGNER